MLLEIAYLVVDLFEAYALIGVGFAMLFLPRAITRFDHGVAGAPWALRLLICPGVVALWPLFFMRWINNAGQPVEHNPQRAKARDVAVAREHRTGVRVTR